MHVWRDSGTPLYVHYHPIRLVPESKFITGLSIEDAAAEEEQESAKEAREEDPNALNHKHFPKVTLFDESSRNFFDMTSELLFMGWYGIWWHVVQSF